MSCMLAIITTGQRVLPSSLKTHIASDTVLYIHCDHERRGVAYSRNECIHAFYESPHEALFLMDDDVDLRVKGWEKIFTHSFRLDFAAYPAIHKEAPANSLGPMSWWHTTTGAFYYMTKQHVAVVGYFNTKLGRYGWTDVGYMHRCKRVYGPTLPFPIQALVAISPRDLFGSHEQRSTIMSVEEKREWVERNRPIHLEEINGPVYLPYHQ